MIVDAKMIHKQPGEVVLRNALPLPLVFGPPGNTEAQRGPFGREGKVNKI